MQAAAHFGVFGPLVSGAGCLLATVAALLAGWRGRANWEPVDEDLPAGARKVSGVLSVVLIATLWTLTRTNSPSLSFAHLRTSAIFFAVGAVTGLLFYGLLLSLYVYHLPSAGTHDARRLGGLWLHKNIRERMKRAELANRPLTLQALITKERRDVDSVWPRMAIGLVKQSVVLAYLTLVVCGTSAVASATLLVEASLNSPAVAPYALSDSSWNGRRKVFEEAIRQIGTKDGLSAQLRDELSRFADSCPVSLGAPSKDCIAQIYREASRYVGWRRCSDNSCEEIPRHKRCATHPTNLFEQQLLYKDSIVLGTIFQDYTHSYASAAAAWVSDQIRDRHGILGKNIAVVSCTVNEDSSIDNLTPDEAARSTAQYLADEVGVTLIIGADSSDRTIAVLNALVGRDVTVISPAATSTVLSQLNTNMGKTPGPWFLRTIPSNKYEGAVLADLALRATPKDGLVALISQNSAYGSDLAQFVSRGLHRAMLNNQTLFERHFSGEFQLQSVLTELKSVSNLRSIVLISSTATDYQLLLNSVRLAEIRDPDGQPPSLLFPDSAMVETIFSDVPESILVRVLGTRPSVTHRDFLAKLNAGFRSDRPDLNEDLESGYGAETLDAVWLSAYSLAFTADRHGIVIGAAMIDQLLALATQSGSSCTHLQLGPDTLREWENAFSAKVPICPEGVSGPITIERTTGDMVGSYETWIPHTNPEGRSTVAFVSRSTR